MITLGWFESPIPLTTVQNNIWLEWSSYINYGKFINGIQNRHWNSNNNGNDSLLITCYLKGFLG